jgi:hypothetical protein
LNQWIRIVLPLYPCCVDSVGSPGPEETKNLAGNALRLIQLRLAKAEFAKDLAFSSSTNPEPKSVLETPSTCSSANEEMLTGHKDADSIAL